jgi:hypothetical protein
MKKVEAVFLSSVFGMASVFTLMSLSQVVYLHSAKSDAGADAVGSAGEARDVDLSKLQRMLRQGYLSEQEAKFYKEFTAWSEPIKKEPKAEAVSSETD